jgi:hypothetical protein
MLTTVETRELGASILAFISPPKEVAAAAPAKKTPAKTASAKNS